MKKFIVLLVLALALAAPLSAFAAALTFDWDVPPGTPPTGYKLYYGKAPGNYTNNLDMGTTKPYTLSNLDVSSGGVWYFAATAYIKDASGTRESAFSNEVNVAFPAAIKNFKITITITP